MGFSFYAGDSHNYAFLKPSDGAMQDIFGDNWSYSYAVGINDNGQVLGMHGSEAVIWKNGSKMELSGTRITATGINNNGQVTGWGPSASGSVDYDAFVWESGTGWERIGDLPGGDSTFTTCINDHGQVVGYSSGSGSRNHAFLWQKDTGMQDLGALSTSTAGVLALDINNNGQVVGQAATDNYCAFLWQPGVGMVDLNSLIDSSSGWRLWEATSINDNGWIVGWGYDSRRQDHGFLLTPVSEPATIVLLLTAILGLLWRPQRQGS